MILCKYFSYSLLCRIYETHKCVFRHFSEGGSDVVDFSLSGKNQGVTKKISKNFEYPKQFAALCRIQ